MIKLKKSTPKRTIKAMLKHLYNFMEHANDGDESCLNDYREDLEFKLKREGIEYSIEIMGNAN